MKLLRVLGRVALGVVAVACSVAACGGNVVVDDGAGNGNGSTGSTGSTGSGNVFSCDFNVAMVHECSEYSNLPAADTSAEQSACEAETGTAGTGCSSTDELGSCAFTTTGIDYAEFFYADGGETADEAQMGCTAAGGTWMPI